MTVSAPKIATQAIQSIEQVIYSPVIQEAASSVIQQAASSDNQQARTIQQICYDTIKDIYSVMMTRADSIVSMAYKTGEWFSSIAFDTLETINSTGALIKNKVIAYLPEASLEFTETKIKQVMPGAFSGYALLGARIMAGGGFPTTFLQWSAATPLLAVSSTAIWYALSLLDYESPEKLEKIRKQAQILPLKQVADLHGWQNIFKYGILSPDEFHKAFCHLADSLSFKDLYAIHTEAKKDLATVNCSSSGCQHQLPSLAQWVKKFKAETADFSHDVILERYRFDDLKEMLTDEDMIPLAKMQLLLNELSEEREVFRKTHTDFLEEMRDKNMKAIHQAQSTLSEIDKALGSDGSEENLPFLGQDFQDLCSEANKKHQFRLAQIQEKMNQANREHQLALANKQQTLGYS